ncbi:MAG: UDP-2,3-diacylglucosamine diphosphatase LpxI, partial [Candidatus Acidiferrum sp.]
VPVVGLPTIEQMKSSRATVLAVDAGRTLLFDRPKLIELADAAEIAIQAFEPAMRAEPNSSSGGINKE